MSTPRVANRDLVNFALRHRAAEGYGNMCVEVEPLGSGYLPLRIRDVFHSRYKLISTVVYSYGTPIAWFDTEYNSWVIPNVSYSVTTSKHQSYLWKLNAARIVFDTPIDEYHRVLKGQMFYTVNGTLPGYNQEK